MVMPLKKYALKVRPFMATFLVALGMIEAVIGYLAWDIVYFLGAPRIAVYWVQYLTTAAALLCFGLAGLMYMPEGWRGRYTLFMAAGCIVVVFMAPISNLYILRVGIPSSGLIAFNAYLVDKYDLNSAYHGPALEPQSWAYNAGYTTVRSLSYDDAFWVEDGKQKWGDAVGDIADRYANMMRGAKQMIYGLPLKKKLEEGMQGANREIEEFQRRQREVEKNSGR